MTSLRHTVADLMVQIHKIAPELAEQYAREMEPSEVKRRFLFYVRSGLSRPGAELSVAGKQIRGVNVSSSQLFTPPTTQACPRHSTLLPENRRTEGRS
jgi:hypothetical protein